MNVMIASDGSPCSENAIRAASRLLSLREAEVTLLAVADLARAGMYETPGVGLAALLDREVQLTHGDATWDLELLAELGVAATAVEPLGEAGQEILAAANQRHPDVLVLGSHGYDAIDRSFLGSVSGYVAEHWHGAVLVVPTRVGIPTPRNERPVILFAADGSASSQHALSEALRLLPLRDATVVIVAVSDGGSWDAALSGLAPNRGLDAVAAKVVGLHHARAVLAEAGVTALTVERHGSPGPEILAVAAEHQADLIVVGSRGRGMLARWVLGSVSTHVLREATAAVLVIGSTDAGR